MNKVNFSINSTHCLLRLMKYDMMVNDTISLSRNEAVTREEERSYFDRQEMDEEEVKEARFHFKG